jgi:hypothetical protein
MWSQTKKKTREGILHFQPGEEMESDRRGRGWEGLHRLFRDVEAVPEGTVHVAGE